MCRTVETVGSEADVSVETAHRVFQTIVHGGADDEG